MHNDYDTKQLWNLFENKKVTYFNIPTISEMKEIHMLLHSDKKELYTVNFEECEKKRIYWEKVRDIYIKNDFIMPHSFRLGKELKFDEIWNYHVTQNEINMVIKIIKILQKEEEDYFMKEHVSYT